MTKTVEKVQKTLTAFKRKTQSTLHKCLLKAVEIENLIINFLNQKNFSAAKNGISCDKRYFVMRLAVITRSPPQQRSDL